MKSEFTRGRSPAGGAPGPLAAAWIAAMLAFSPQGAQAFNPQPEPPAAFYFGPFEIERAGFVTLHVVHPPDPIRPRGQPVSDRRLSVRISFLGPDGELILEQRRVLRQGVIESVDLSGAELIGITGDASDMRLRAEVRILEDRSGEGRKGVVVPQIRIVDGAGMSQYVAPVVKLGFNPQPEPPAR